jgi:hypothetical protein
MPYGGYNRDAQNIAQIGENLGSIVGTFLGSRARNKSRLKLEREQKEKERKIIETQSGFMRRDLGPDDTDLYGMVTDNPTIESLQMAMPEIQKRKIVRQAEQQKAEMTAKEQAEQQKIQDKLEKQKAILRKTMNARVAREGMPMEEVQLINDYLDVGDEEGLKAAQSHLNSWKPPEPKEEKLAKKIEETKRALYELGNGDIKAGFEQAKQTLPDLAQDAVIYGIVGGTEDKKDELEPLLNDLVKDWKSFNEKQMAADEKFTKVPIAEYANTWLADREGVLAPEKLAEIKKRLSAPAQQRKQQLDQVVIDSGLAESPPKRTSLAPDQETKFQEFYGRKATEGGLDPSPDAPEHKYDYRGAFAAGDTATAVDPTDNKPHWASTYKDDDHPTRYILQDGVPYDTKNEKPVSAQVFFDFLRKKAKKDLSDEELDWMDAMIQAAKAQK